MKSVKSLVIAALVAAFTLPTPALCDAQGEDDQTRWSDVETQRPILLPKSGGEVRIDIRSESTEKAFDDTGKVGDLDGDYDLFTAQLAGRYSFLDWWEVSAILPFVTGNVGSTSGGGVGDIMVGTAVDLLPADNFDLAIGCQMSFPTGDAEYHFDYVGGKIILVNFRTGDPNYNYYPGVSFRWLSPTLSVRASAQYIITTKGTIVFNRVGGVNDEVTGDPGDGYKADAGIYWQASRALVPFLAADYANISETEVDGIGMNDDYNLLQLRPGLIWQFDPNTDIEASAGIPVSGRNTPYVYPVYFSIRGRF